MQLDVGMSRAGLRKLAQDILTECDRNDGHGEGVEIMRQIEPNGPNPELTLIFNNDDMEDRDDVGEDTAYWEMDL